MASMQERALEKLNALYEIQRPAEVFAYLAQYPNLERILIESHAQILELFGNDATIRMELFVDIEEDDEMLFGYISSALDHEAARQKLFELDSWFSYSLPRFEGYLNFDLEY